MAALIPLFVAAVLLLSACNGAASSDGDGAKTEAGKSSEGTSGAYPYEKSPLLKDDTLLPSAAAAIGQVERLRVITHTTAKKAGKLTVADDNEVVFIAPRSAKWMYQSLVTGARSETIRIDDKVWTSSSRSKTWSEETTDVATYDFQPSQMADLLLKAGEVHLIKKDVPQEWSQSTWMVEFTRESPVYPGQMQQVVVFIDDVTKLPVRFEFLDNKKKPTDFTETFFRLSDYGSPDLKVSPPE
jgi:hypothetical protein